MSTRAAAARVSLMAARISPELLLAEVVPCLRLLSRSFWPKDGEPGCMDKEAVSDVYNEAPLFALYGLGI